MEIQRIYLTGFMAAGKSSVGRALANELNLPFLDLDKYLEEKENRRITQIFQKNGEAYFREKERQYLKELARSYKGILALGGGSLQNQNIVNLLKETGILVYIETPTDVTLERVLRNTKRPIVLDKNGKLKPKEVLKKELDTLFETRKKFYNQADIKIFSEGNLTHSKVAQKIIKKMTANEQ